MKHLIFITVKSKGGNPGTFIPAPRPYSARQEWRDSERRRRHAALRERLLPHREPRDGTEGGPPVS